MGYAKHVGRVGALALALGIGTAVATPAWAETLSGSESASSASESSQKPSSRRSTPATSGDSADSGGSAGTSGSDGSTTPAGGNDNDAAVEDEADIEVEPEAAEEAPPLVDEGVEESDARDGDSASAAPEVDSSATTVQSYDIGAPESGAPADEAPASTSPNPDPEPVGTEITASPTPLSYALAVTAPPVEPAPAPLVRQPQGPVGVILGGPAAMLDIAARALHMLFNPGPTVPGDPPLLLGVLAFVRREIQRTFFNSSPTAVADATSTSEGLAKRISVLNNDIDPNIGDVLTVTDFTQAANGVVELNADGSFNYTPTGGFSGTDTFTYTISDEASSWHGHVAGLIHGHTSTATVSVTVLPAPVNESPSAADDSVSTAEDTPAVIDVKANDSDPNGDDISIASVGAAQHGTVAVLDGRITYTPEADFHGTDTFDYTITDGDLTDTASVTVTVAPVNDAPVAVDDVVTVAGSSVANVINVLGNDTDVDTTDTLTVTAVGTPTQGGSVAINADKTLSYTPAAGFSGTETFTYITSDGTDAATGTVTVTVTPVAPANTPPVAVNDTYTMPTGATSATVNVVANDTDADGDTLTVTAVTGATNGTTTFTGGTITYTPTTGYAGTETLTYTVSDVTDTATATLTIVITTDNLAPEFANPPLSEDGLSLDPETGAITGRVIASDPEGEAIEFGIAEPPDATHAEVSIDPATGEFRFVPTDLARFLAAVDPEARTMSFRISASDGINVRTMNLVVPVTPKHPTDDGILDLADLDTLAQYGAVQVSENDNGAIGAIIGTFTDEKVMDGTEALHVLEQIAGLLGLRGSFDGLVGLQAIALGDDEQPERVYRISQNLYGIPVIGGEVLLTTLGDGTVTGVFAGTNASLQEIDTTPAPEIDEEHKAISAAAQHILDGFEDPLSEEEQDALLDAMIFDATLVVYALDPSRPPILAWRVSAYTPPGEGEADDSVETTVTAIGVTYYIQANGPHAGSVFAEELSSAGAWASTTTTAAGLPHGDSPRSYRISIQRDGGREQLVDSDRNIRTFTFLSTSSNYWQRSMGPVATSPFDTSAVSAHGNMEIVYDYYSEVLGRHSYTGSGSSTPIRVALWRPDVDNAEFVVFADGYQIFRFGRNSEAALDIVGHEYTHAVLHSIHGGFPSSGAYQAHALGEAYGDIIGSLIENKRDAGEWLFGEDAEGNPWRDLKDPGNFGGRSHFNEFVNADGQTYKNSTIFSHAAYRMITDPRTADVPRETWAKIFYSSMFRFGRDATFQNARNAVIAAASVQHLTPDQQNAIADAFSSVGIVETPRVKIILRWGINPSDLDSHLTGPSTIDGERFHISYLARNFFRDGTYTGGAVGAPGRLAVNLDYDDTTSYGPETTTIRDLVPGEYTFYVHDFTNRVSSSSSALGQSGATVTVLKPGQNSGGIVFRANTAQEGTTWTVFKINIHANGSVTVTSIDSYGYTPPSLAVVT